MNIKHLIKKVKDALGSAAKSAAKPFSFIFKKIWKGIKFITSPVVNLLAKLWKLFVGISAVGVIVNNRMHGVVYKFFALIILLIKVILLGIGWILHYVFLPITYPLSIFWKWFSDIPNVRKVLDSKAMSFIKAILSVFIWGIGQLFNGQKLKALLFFIIFLGFVGIELGTSHYFDDIDPYDKIPVGQDFGDDYIASLMGDFYDPASGNLRFNYPEFEAYLEEIGKSGDDIFNLTEDEFIAFIASDLRSNNPITYTNLEDDTVYLDYNEANMNYLFDQTYYFDSANQLFYQEVTNDDNTKEFVNIDLANNELNENNKVDSVAAFDEVIMGHNISQSYDGDMNYYIEAQINGVLTYLNLETYEQTSTVETSDVTHIVRSQDMFVDANGIYYTVRDISGTTAKYYVETDLLTGITNEDNVLISKDGLVEFNKTNHVYRVSQSGVVGFFMEAVTIDDAGEDVTKYINVKTGEVFDSLDGTLETISLEGPMYLINNTLFEYYRPGLVYLNRAMNFESTLFTQKVRQSMAVTYSQDWNTYTDNDYVRFMIKVYFEIYPDERLAFENNFDNFYFDQAGLFVRSYWAVITLGTADNVDLVNYNTLKPSLVGDSNNAPKVDVSILPAVPVLGHVTAQILIEGIIGIITSIIFFIFMIWSVRDAYRVSEAKRKKKIVLNDVEYFSETFEQGFAYFVLAPAMVVLGYISIMPIVFGFIIAFTGIQGDQSLIARFDYNGLQNFVNLFDFTGSLGATFGRAFWRVLGWTIVWAIFSTATVFFGGFFQAIILNSEKVVFRKFWRTILILPWAIPALLSQMIFKVMFAETGYINQLMSNIGIYDILTKWGMIGQEFETLSGIQKFFYLGNQNIQWFTNPNNPTFVRIVLIVVNIWLGFPYFMALMTGVMTAIDKTLYEAADIDGASNGQKLWKITMPLVLYSTAPILIMTFSGNFNNFGVIYFITGGGPNAGNFDRGFAGDTDILISWMYKLTVDESIYNMASVFSVLIFFFVGSVTAWNLSRTRAFTED